MIVTSDPVSEEDIAKLIIPDDLPNDEPSFKAYIEAKVYDKEGHLIQYHRQLMRSLTQYFLALMTVPLIGTFQSSSTISATSVLTNVLGLVPKASNTSNCAGIQWDFSIQLGSGSQAFSPTLTSLAAPIANGSGSGQLIYSNKAISYTSTSISISISVQNSSGSTINVTEIGLIGNVQIVCYGCSSPYSYNFLLSYDTFSVAISVPNAGLATFQVTLEFSG